MQSKFEIFQMEPKNTNSVLVSNGKDCVIFDAWGNSSDWIKLLNERGLNLRAIYSTHGHPDHISAAPDLARTFDVPWYLHPADKCLIGWGNEILDMFGIKRLCSHHDVPNDLDCETMEILPETKMHIIHTPGHSAGGVSFWFPDYRVLITGDTIFNQGFGRYDFPTGDKRQLEQSISKLYDMNLEPETYVVHGHGPDSVIDSLKKNNPLFKHYD